MSQQSQEAMNKRLWRVAYYRKCWLLVIAMGLGGGLGYLSIFIDSLFPRYVSLFGPPSLQNDFLAVFVGGIIGLFSSILVIPTCCNKDLRYALPMVYMPTAVVIAWKTWTLDPASAIFWGFITLGIACIIVWRIIPRGVRKENLGKCEFCGYDLRGAPTTRCPECGRENDPSDCNLFPGVHQSVLGEVTLFRVLTSSRIRRISVLLCLLGLMIIGPYRYLWMFPSYTEFRYVQFGMSEDQVIRFMGKPDRISEKESGQETWLYRGSGGKMYVITMKDGSVAGTSTSTH